MQGHPVWFEIYVSDIAAAEGFYTAVFQWELAPLEGMPLDSYRMISNSPQGSLGGAIVAGFPERAGSGTIVYFEVHDLADSIAAVEAHGGSKQTPLALIRDPDGNLLGLWAPELGA